VKRGAPSSQLETEGRPSHHAKSTTELSSAAVLNHEVFLETSGGVVDLALGVDGSLYFTRLFAGDIQRVTYPAGLSSNPNDPNNNDNDPDDPGAGDPGAGNTPPQSRLCGAGATPAMWMGLCLFCAMRTRTRHSRRTWHV